MEPENTWPEPPPPLAPGAREETVESHYLAREVDPRYPSHESGQRYHAPRPTPPVNAAQARREYVAARARQIIYLVLGILETFLVLRFALKLLAANPEAGFSSFIYALTEPFVAPFNGVFPTPQTQGAILDLATVLAMIVYILLAWGAVSVIYTLVNRRPTQSI